MGQFNDITGKRFGKLIVVSLHGRSKKGNGFKPYQWLCKCDCGGTRITRTNSLVSGMTISCGCMLHKHKKHGLYYHHLDNIYCHMISRCHNEKDKSYKYYGGRGIFVCDEWRRDVRAFVDHLLSIGWTKDCGLSIDRINNNDGYHPSNVRLATNIQQARNNSKNTLIEYNGEIAPIAEWAERIGMPYGRLQARIFRGWSIERAMTQPSQR